MWLCECLCAGDGLLNDQLTLWRFDVSRQKREWVWGSESVGWSRLTTSFGAHWDTASCSVVIFYYWVVPYTVDIKLVEQLSLKKVRRCACEITLCSLSLNWTSLISCKTQDRGDVSEVIKYALEKCKNHPESFFQIGRWSACFCSFLLYLHPAKKLTKIVNLKMPLRKSSFSNCHIGRKESRKDNGGSLISMFGLLVWLFSHKAN